MTVIELIAELQKQPCQGAPVRILGEFNGRYQREDGSALTEHTVGQVVSFGDVVAITRII